MSLIADALKRAQDQRRGGGDDGARRLLTPSGPLRVPARRRREVSRSMALAGLALGVSAAVFGLAVLLTPRPEIGGQAMAATHGATSSPVAGTPDQGPGAGAIVGGDGVIEDSVGRLAAGVTGTGAGTKRGSDAGPVPGTQSEAQAGPGTDGSGAGPDAHTGTGTGGEASTFRMTLVGEGPSSQEAADLGARALGAQQRGDLETALTLYVRALELRPVDPQLHNNLGTVYRAMGRAGEAYRAFRAALDADPGYAPAWNNVGLMLDGMDRRAEAEDAWREALRLAPTNAGARVNLANAYGARGLYREAMELLRGALATDPTLPEAHYALARLLEATADPDAARRHYELFLRHGEDEFAALAARVRAHLAGEGGGA